MHTHKRLIEGSFVCKKWLSGREQSIRIRQPHPCPTSAASASIICFVTGQMALM